jgi:hypothetical protein
MNDLVPPVVPLTPEFEDRRTGLIVVGILEIALGVLAGLMVPLMILAQTMASRVNHDPVNVRQLIPSAAFYVFISAALVSVGIGSCKTRRWARALSLVLGWSWLAFGVITMAMMAFFMPSAIRASQPKGQQVPETALMIGMVFAMVFMSIFFIAVPVILVLFYRSPHVKATCEARNPSPSWTDACPLPVLGLSLWLWTGVVGMLALPLSTHGVLPLFGKVLSGFTGSACGVLLAVLWSYCAWGVYRLRSASWWIVLISVCLFSVSAWITFSHIDMSELYKAGG